MLDAQGITFNEFQGYNGDCGEYALLAALHGLDPAHYAFSPVNLRGITAVAIGHYGAAPSGAEPLGAIAAEAVSWYGAKVENYGYAEPYAVDWVALLNEHAGVHPVILELSHAGNLPGDEPGVHYHFICQLNRGQFADGDHSPAAPVSYTDDELRAAGVCGALVVLETGPQQHPAPAPAPAPSGWQHYTVQPGDTLSRIAARLHLANWYHDLYQPNMATIEAAARAHHQPDSNSGNLIYAGTVLEYR